MAKDDNKTYSSPIGKYRKEIGVHNEKVLKP